jgi:DNA topoisomerase-1
MAWDAGDDELRAAGLIYVNDDDPGLTRHRRGDRFVYRDPEGAPVRAPEVLERIQALAIPPAWTGVWISPSPRGHIQAIGRDRRGRKQYRYHEGFRRSRDASKFERMIAFGRALPRLRRAVEADLPRAGLPRDKVLAAVVRVMELTMMRVGNEEYARLNRTFGLTTLRDRHARIGGSEAIFEFRGKSGKVHKTGFRDRRLARIIKACQDLPGQRLFQYLDADGERRQVESSDVNQYIRDRTCGAFSAKDFRTWAATLAAAEGLVRQTSPRDLADARRQVNACVKAVASLLGNTAAVCRRSYIHPLVLEAYVRGDLPLRPKGTARAFELSVLRFLEGARVSASQLLE